ncbi:hypothetical protein, partial [Pseudomonas gessardii]
MRYTDTKGTTSRAATTHFIARECWDTKRLTRQILASWLAVHFLKSTIGDLLMVSGVGSNSFNASKAALDDAMRAEQLQAKEDQLQGTKDLNDSKRDSY